MPCRAVRSALLEVLCTMIVPQDAHAPAKSAIEEEEDQIQVENHKCVE